jgi:5-formyltetrahydrofolate cyclo-ligase
MQDITQANVKHQIRASMREKRGRISNQDYLKAAKSCADIIIKNNILDNQQNIAFYLSQDNELDLYLLIEHCLTQKKSCYLPILDNKRLKFAQYTHKSILQSNKYNIPEPVILSNSQLNNNIIQAKQLDLVFVPLVAFTKSGQRLGMGGGYYDQTFAFLANLSDNNNIKPRLIGIAYDLQCLDSLPVDSWDINLNGIATESLFIEI